MAFLHLSGCWTVSEIEAKSGMRVPRWVADRVDDLGWFSDVPQWHLAPPGEAVSEEAGVVLDPAVGAGGLLLDYFLPE